MATKLAYLASPGLVPKILAKIQEARRPQRFTTDFLETKLGHSGGSARAFAPLLKRMGFLETDGSPTARYDRFRNQTTQGAAVAAGIKQAYSDLYDRNEYAHDLPKEKLIGLIMEITGASKDDSTTRLTVSTFNALKDLADFDAEESEEEPEAGGAEEIPPNSPEGAGNQVTLPQTPQESQPNSVGFNISYTINLNLPETTNPDVFNAIFRSLKENLLKNQ